jgi:uncharacterized membrane protein
MRLALLLFLLMGCSVCANTTRIFQGTATIEIVEPTDTRVAICTPNEKYSMVPGSTLSTKLYVRNDMKNKTVMRMYVKEVEKDGFIVSFNPEYLEDILPGDYKYWNLTIEAEEGLKEGSYELLFLLATDEHEWGSYEERIIVRVSRHASAVRYAMLAMLIIITVAIAIRWLWIRSVNKKPRKRINRKARSISYYKP